MLVAILALVLKEFGRAVNRPGGFRWARFFFVLWVVGSVMWGVVVLFALGGIDPVYLTVLVWAAPALVILALGRILRWVLRSLAG